MFLRLLSGILILSLTLLLSGCELMETLKEEPSYSVVPFSVKIISEPSGAKVEVNDNYIGKTPITVKLVGWKSTRTFARRHTIVAHPVRAGGYTQSKTFSGWHEPSHSRGDTIPKKIYFNMNLESVIHRLFKK